MSHALKSAQQSQSIQTLLEAEKDASKVVQQARQCKNNGSRLGESSLTHLTTCSDRVQKLKDARAEASKEIEAYKKAKEDEFKAFEASVRGRGL